MKLSVAFVAMATLFSAGSAVAEPLKIVKRANNGKGLSKQQQTDRLISQFALTLENLEVAFYSEMLDKYDAAAFAARGFGSDVYQLYRLILEHEQTHANTLINALKQSGGAPKPCTYQFPAESLEDYITLSRVFEGVGASAYAGAIPSLSPAVAGLAASIGPIESRQQSLVTQLTTSQNANSANFETALGAEQVFSLAAPFIKSCPKGYPTFPFKALPSPTIYPAGPAAGDTVKISNIKLPKECKGKAYVHAIFGISDVVTQVKVANDGTLDYKIPANAEGRLYVVLSASPKPLGTGGAVTGAIPVEVLSNRA